MPILKNVPEVLAPSIKHVIHVPVSAYLLKY